MHRTLTVLLLALLASQVAAEEKVIRMYNWNDYIAPQVLVDFEKKTGIRVDYSTFSSAEELDEAMASNQPFDIIVPSNDLLPNLIRNGKLTPLDKTKLVNSKHLDRQLLGKLSAFDPKNRYAIPYLWGSIGLAINTPKAEAAFGGPLPNSWSLVFDPAHSAKLASCGISELDEAADVFTHMMTYKGRVLSDSSPRQIQKAAHSLRLIRPNLRMVDSELYIDELSAGNLCVSVAYVGDAFSAEAAGQPVGFFIPEEGSTMFVDSLVIPANAPHPELAMQFLDYMMLPEVAAAISNETLYPNANADSEPFLDDALRTKAGFVLDKETRRRLSLLPALPDNISQVIDQQWELFRTPEAAAVKP